MDEWARMKDREWMASKAWARCGRAAVVMAQLLGQKLVREKFLLYTLQVFLLASFLCDPPVVTFRKY